MYFSILAQNIVFLMGEFFGSHVQIKIKFQIFFLLMLHAFSTPPFGGFFVVFALFGRLFLALLK